MDSEGKLKDYLIGLEADGTVESEGAFKLDPHRAAEILREQGRLGKGAPLYLLSAIHRQSQGSPVSVKHGLMSTRLEWTTELASLKPTVELVLAEESFLAHGLILEIGSKFATLYSQNKLQPVMGSLARELFEEVQERTRLYPFQGKVTNGESWREQDSPQAKIQLLVGPDRNGRIDWVVDGLIYRGSWSIPVDCQVFTSMVRPDITLSVLPDSEAKTMVLKAAETLFLDGVAELLSELKEFTVRNTEGRHTDCQEHLLSFLAFLTARPANCPLREQALNLVGFLDIYENRWSLRALLDSYQQLNSLLVMPSLPKTLPSSEKVDRPVILWDGPTKTLLRQIFARVSSAAGYLYSLERNETESARIEEIQRESWAETEFEDGRLALIPWDQTEDPAQVQFLGKRRSAETFYLPEQAPNGLKILWNCQREVGSLSPQDMVTDKLLLEILRLTDQALENQHRISSDSLLRLLNWIQPSLEALRGLASIWKRPIFADLAGEEHSLETLDGLTEAGQCLKILRNKSTTLPDPLPQAIVLWHNDLLDHLGFPIQGAEKELREAHWKADGRARWLERWRPQKPELLGAVSVGPHLLAKKDPKEPCLVTVWREGRPLGTAHEWDGQCLGGFDLIYVDDEFPADPYWAGPCPEELHQRASEFDELCQRH